MTEKTEWHKLNMQRITDVLIDLDARQIRTDGTPKTGMMHYWTLRNGKMLLVQEFANDTGFEVYTPLSESMKVSDIEQAIKDYGKQ